MANPRSRGWCFTINNWTDADLAQVEAMQADAAYLVVGKEKGEEGTPHLQGYVYFNDNKTFTRLKKYLPRAHLTCAKGTAAQNKAYCSKQGDFTEVGELPVQGKRTDIDACYQMLKERVPMKEVMDQAPSIYARLHRGLKDMQVTLVEPRDFKPRVIVRWGKAGSGKTRWVYDNFPKADIYCKPPGQWFDKYVGQPVALFDDFYGDVPYHVMLRLLDRYPELVPFKGGFVHWRPEVMVITSNRHPEDWYRNIRDKSALFRRIDEIVKVGDQSYLGDEYENFPGDGVEPDYLEPQVTYPNGYREVDAGCEADGQPGSSGSAEQGQEASD